MALYQAPAALHAPLGVMPILAFGFLLGMRHATDADHVVAVSTIVSRERRIGSAAWIGALWGAGHTVTILGVGICLIVFALAVPARLGLLMECCVGAMLVLLGGINLRTGSTDDASQKRFNADDSIAWKSGSGRAHSHHHHGLNEGSTGWADRLLTHVQDYGWLRPLLVGLVHGLAGSAAVALLVLTTLHNTGWAAAYLAIFGAGTIAGMMLITVAMASAIHLAGSRSARINRSLSMLTGLLSVAFGLVILYQMGFVHGLFTKHPTWTPH